jgi:uncharacterized protein (DUF1330 family)
MKCYAVAEIEITDPSWVPAYVENTTALVERYGGRYLARTPKIERLEGEREPPQIYLIIEWPSRQVAEDFYASDEYRPYLESRQAGSKGEFFLVAGEDVNRVAQMPRESPAA